MRACWRVTAAWLFAVVTVAAPAAAVAQDAEPTGPSAAIEPATDLVDGQRVTLTGTGFPPDRFVAVVQCPTGVTDPERCGKATFPDDPVASDGSLTTDVFVDAVFSSQQGEVDCRVADTCVLVVDPPGFGGQPSASVEVPLHFDPDAPLVPPSRASIDPDRELVDGQVVTVSGSGFRPGRFVQLLQCAPGSEPFSSCAFSNAFPNIDDQGSFTTTMTLAAMLRGPKGPTDCRTVADPCVVVVTEDGFNARRTVRVPLAFDPDAPLLPPPTIEVSPATGVEDGSTITVRGGGFLPGADVQVALCEAGSSGPTQNRCDDRGGSYANADAAGAFDATMSVVAEFTPFDGARVDCRKHPGCEVVAHDYSLDRDARAPITFAPAPPSRGRFLDPIFDEVEVTRDVVYRDTIDYQGNAVQLHLDVYQPKGDTETKRPVIVWMHGGYFIFGDKSSMASYAEEFARRGYVAVSLQYRLRRGISTTDGNGQVAAAYDAYDDAKAGVAWLRSHADEYRIDPDHIAAGGYSAGAVTSLNLAYFHDERGDPVSPIGAAVSIAGVAFGPAQAGDPPSIVFHGTADTTVPFAAGEGTCLDARGAGVACELVRYEGGTHSIVSQFERDIVRRTADFLGQHLLGRGAPAEPSAPTVSGNAVPAPVLVAVPRFTG